ncbi:MAG: hypothetical protein HC904_05595 [Blastochloris sp.]|nr:hypothetical protein [Blastochloris sp.]
MMNVHAEEFWLAQKGLKENTVASADVEIFQGTAAYLMGLGYFERVADFTTKLERWHKRSTVSFFAHGFSKLSPRRNPDGSLPNSGDLDLIYPNVDMSFRVMAYAANGTLHADSPAPYTHAGLDYLNLLGTEVSAQEHRSINRYLNQSNAASSIRLLHLAQQQGASMVELTKASYVSKGEVTYASGGQSKMLKDWDPGMWTQITNTFNNSDGNYVVVYITPGPVWAADGSYHGLGGFLVGRGQIAALISGHLFPANGGFGGGLSLNSFNTTNYNNISLYSTNSRNYTLNLAPPSITAPVFLPSTPSTWNFSTTYNSIVSNSYIPTPSYVSSFQTQALFNNVAAPTTSSGFANFFSKMLNIGTSAASSFYGAATSTIAGWGTTIADPVHVLTGAFYHDEVDLRLNGPMPLEIRRNYDSKNLGDNSFGWGWKLSYQPYMVLSDDQSLISASEMDGSVIYYRRQAGNPNQWLPTTTDNPLLINIQGNSMGGLGNVLNAKIDKSTVGNDTIYTLTGVDASTRIYTVQAFPAYIGTALNGLTARYFDNMDFTNQKLVRTDATIDFNFGTGSPDPSIGVDTFSVRWTGKIKAPVTGTYTFKTSTDDGVRLWVNGTQIINKWVDQAETPWSGTITLTAGQKYDIKMEYYENGVGAVAKLSWSYPGQAEQIVPASALFAENNGLERERPYLTKWQDNRGNYYNFLFGNDITKPEYGELRRIEASNGNFLGFSYDRFGHITEAYTRDGRRVSYTYDEFGDLVEVTRPDSSSVQYEYKHNSQLVGTKFENYSEHLIIRERKPDGRILENDYDSQNRVTAQRATVGTDLVPVQNVSFTYSNTTNADKTLTGTTVVRDAYNRATTYTYASSLITQITDPNNNSIVQEWYLPGDTSTGAYPRSMKRSVDKRGLETQFKYDTRGNLVETKLIGDINGDGVSNASDISTNTTQYNPTKNIPDSITDALGNKTLFFYENANYPYLPTRIEKRSSNNTLITKTINAFGNQGSTVPFAKGLLQTETRAEGSVDQAVTTMTYNNNGYLTSRTRQSGTSDPNVTTAFSYNLRGELVEKKDAANRKWTYFYDDMGRLTGEEVRNESGQLLSWNYQYYNLNGELEWTDGPRFGPEDYVWKKYDGGGRPLEELRWRSQAKADGSGVEVPVGDEFFATTFYKHNLFGDLLEVIDPYRNSTVMTYDAIGQLLSKTQYQGSSSGTLLSRESYLYEPGGQVRHITSSLGAVTQIFYTATGQPRRKENPDGSVLIWEYDLSGRPKKETLSNGSYWTTDYDDAARMVTRTFRNSSGTVLATESKSFDRRGNCISQTDREGNTFTTTYDDLDRVKTVTGPAATASSAQQLTTTVYDNSGKVLRVINALNEETETTTDALQRPVTVKVKDSGGNVKSQTSFSYSVDHHSITQTTGTGSAAISSITYTDNEGRPVLTINGSGQKRLTGYTQSPRWIVSKDELGQLSTSILDARGLAQAMTKPGGAVTEMVYNAAGNVLEHRMPGNLVHKTVYDTLSRKQSEELRNGSTVSRQYSYTYYPSGPAIGLPQTTTDPRGIIFTSTYDAFLRPALVTAGGSQPEHNLTTNYSYDLLGRVLTVDQSFALSSTGPSTKIIQTWDGYGQLNSETVEINGSTARRFNQKWNAAGRRTELTSPDSSLPSPLFAYTWQADGLLKSVTAKNQTYTYNYADNGLLTQKISPFRTQNILTRDASGRITAQNSVVGSGTPLSEVMSWRANSTLDDYTATRNGSGTWNETRDFTYNARGQLLSESYAPASGQSATLNYQFDGNTAGSGLGVRSKAQVSGGYLVEATSINTLVRVVTETTNNEPRSYTATGAALGADSVKLQVNGQELSPVTFPGFLDESGNWSVPMSLPPGSHQLVATAIHPSGEASPSATSSFSIATQNQTLSNDYDAAGNTITRSFSGGRNQTLKWDAYGRLLSVSERNAANDGYDWSAVYDAMGRRLQTQNISVQSATPNQQSAIRIDSWFDPQVEFLEVGVSLSQNPAPSTPNISWKVYGVDICGTFGGCQGIGGLESVIPPTGTATGVIQDYFGNQVATSNGASASWSGIRLGGYGPLPGSWSPALNLNRSVAEVTAWKGKRADETGLVYLGARYYEPNTGRFLSTDPMGHGASMSLYDYANGDPVNFMDPDGRFGKGIQHGSVQVVGGFASMVYNGGGTLGYGLSKPIDWALGTNFAEETYGQQLRGTQQMVLGLGQLAGDGFLATSPLTSWTSYGDSARGRLGEMGIQATGGEDVSIAYRVGSAGTQLFAAYATARVGNVELAGAARGTGLVNDGLSTSVRNSFTGGKATPWVAETDTILFRGENFGQGAGRFFGTQRPINSMDAEMLYNLKLWGNNATELGVYRIPAGTRGFIGGVEGGAGTQIFVPNTSGVQLLERSTLFTPELKFITP